ncbi:MAG: putative deoxyhypusine synthase [Deltaproteobacteria bacterium ADurb.Bin151]|jgi:deoxyhypusine synthase|nr:MAG: putative deoxyhypusine synthase [Deltaproteobacteria bacterium ADurb.Bin151]HNZ11558.1 deoxyhypusine synthase family protein [Smithellaceae bacterium]HOG82440.1 deoxyhypusine synthase family protein [Smithellaceae bacterium]HOQ42407.1 deoxyhypusine synthase family protein [Smithellaceae bacterium]HPL66038.1 deoxyhypusine synthase family protein [Smithellaceae bacterium]
MNRQMSSSFQSVKEFIKKNFRHFNAAVLADASEAYIQHLHQGGRMMVAMGGAMSTAEIGITLAEMIRQDKVHAISCTGANLEEDVFNLIAHRHYYRISNYRDLTPQDEADLLKRKLNRVTDTCIPEEEAMRKVENRLFTLWERAEKENKRYFPYEFIFQLIQSGVLKEDYEIDEKDSWIIAACEKNIPVFVPGWEDSTLGNVFVSTLRKGKIKNAAVVKSGLETMDALIEWYLETSRDHGVGFLQIAGGVSGDFAISVVPLIRQDMQMENCRLWSYFCQISDSTTSYGSYSGAVPNEKITWDKLSIDTPRFIIESDATIVVPLMFAYILAE